MKLIELIEDLQLTQLHGLAVSHVDANDPDKTAHRKKQIILWINKSVSKIYREFNMNQKVYSFNKKSGIPSYTMPEDYMNVFEINVLDKIVPINRDDRPDSMFTPKPFTIDIPEIYNGNKIHVGYFAKAPKLVNDNDIVPLEDQYMIALMLYVAYLANELIKGSPNWEHQSYLTKYNTEVNSIRSEGLAPHTGIMNRKIYQKGFV